MGSLGTQGLFGSHFLIVLVCVPEAGSDSSCLRFLVLPVLVATSCINPSVSWNGDIFLHCRNKPEQVLFKIMPGLSLCGRMIMIF